MANRFPLIFNSGAGQIQELAASDNLDLTSSNLVNAGILFTSSGSATAPSLQIGSGTTYNPGLYSPGTDQLAISTNGTSRLSIDASGNVAVDTNTLYVDATNNRVGVGTSAPVGPFHVKATTDRNLIVGTNIAGDLRFTALNDAANANVNLVLQGDAIYFAAGGAERLRITSAGLVGIGNGAPTGLLHLSSTFGTTLTTGLRIDGLGQTTNNVTPISFFNQSSNWGTQHAANIACGNLDGTNGGGYLRFSTSPDGNTAPTEKLRITATGLVGIGNTTPDAKLHITGGVNSSGGEANLAVTSSTTASVPATISSFNSDATLQIFAGGLGSGSSRGGQIDFKGGAAASDAGTILFRTGTGTGGTSQTEKARIDSSGRLLVGTSTARSNVFQSSLNITPQNQFETNKGNYEGGLSLINCSADGHPATLTFGQSQTNTLGGNALTSNNEFLGLINFTGNDGNNFRTGAQISAFVDGTPGAGDMPGRIVFSVTGDGSASPTPGLRIVNNRQVDIYTNGGEAIWVATQRAASTSDQVYQASYGATDFKTGTVSYKVYTNGNVQNTNNSYGQLSDIKLKENIVNANSQWNDLKNLQVRNFNFKEGQTHTQIGLIAQEVELVSPGLVNESPDRDSEGNDLGTVTKSVNYSVLYMKAVKALQEAMERIEQLEAAVTALQQS